MRILVAVLLLIPAATLADVYVGQLGLHPKNTAIVWIAPSGDLTFYTLDVSDGERNLSQIDFHPMWLDEHNIIWEQNYANAYDIGSVADGVLHLEWWRGDIFAKPSATTGHARNLAGTYQRWPEYYEIAEVFPDGAVFVDTGSLAGWGVIDASGNITGTSYDDIAFFGVCDGAKLTVTVGPASLTLEHIANHHSPSPWSSLNFTHWPYVKIGQQWAYCFKERSSVWMLVANTVWVWTDAEAAWPWAYAQGGWIWTEQWPLVYSSERGWLEVSQWPWIWSYQENDWMEM